MQRLNKTRFSFSRERSVRGQSGQTLIEFVLVISLTVGVSIQIYRTANDAIRDGFKVLNAELEKSMQTGSFDEATAWSN